MAEFFPVFWMIKVRCLWLDNMYNSDSDNDPNDQDEVGSSDGSADYGSDIEEF